METLKAELVDLSKREGAALVGVAPPERFDGAMRGHHPRNFVPEVRSIIMVGVPLLELVLDWEDLLKDSELVPAEARMDILQGYFYRETGYDLVNDMLALLGLRLALFLELRGHRALSLSPTVRPQYREVTSSIPGGRGLFSNRHAAVRTGLGEFGLNNLVVTPQFGPHVRFTTILTEAELPPDPLLTKKTCLGQQCSLCLEACPGAITLRTGFDPQAVWYDPPARTDIERCRELTQVYHCLGRCMRVCPVGRKGPPKKGAKPA